MSKSELVKRWIVLEGIAAIVLALHWGPEGLAQFFCDHVPLQRCVELGWTTP